MTYLCRAFQLLSYPTSERFAGEPEEATTAEYSFRFLRKDAPFLIASSSAVAVKEVQEFLRPYGLQASTLSLGLFKLTGNLVFPLFVGLQLEGWRGLSVGKTSRLVAGSMGEMLYYHYRADGLGRGLALSYMMTSVFVLFIQRVNDKMHAPIDFYRFSHFHHGGKVLSQDRLAIEDYISAGEKLGLEMKACRELLREADAQSKPKS